MPFAPLNLGNMFKRRRSNPKNVLSSYGPLGSYHLNPNTVRSRANSCTGKVRHRNWNSAITALKKVNNAGLSGHYCPFCKGWHLGNQSEKMQLRLDQLLGPVDHTKPKE